MWNWVNKAALKITLFDINSRIVNWQFKNCFRGVGKVIDLKINFKEKKLYCSLLLNGETESITLSATGFELVNDNNRFYVEISSVQVNREWLNTIANQFAIDRKIEIPKQVYNTLTGLFGK
jgi:hypothetical protein